MPILFFIYPHLKCTTQFVDVALFLRAVKVSIETMLQACLPTCRNANAPTTERRSREVRG